MASLPAPSDIASPPKGVDRREWYRTTYLRSAHWRTTRLAALERAEHRCQICDRGDQLDVHHRTYERLGCERPADLTVLCRKCHDLFHGSRPVKRHTPKPDAVRVDGVPNPRTNWSKLTKTQQNELTGVVLGQLSLGPQTSQQIAAAIGSRTGVVGSCLVTCRRRGVVFRNAGRAWKVTTKGAAM